MRSATFGVRWLVALVRVYSITTGHFTADAKREATRDGAPQIELINGEQLCDLLKSLSSG